MLDGDILQTNDTSEIGCIITLLAMTLVQCVPVLAEEAQDGYPVTFVTEHATIDVYYTQDYTEPSEVNVSSAVARNSDTGEVDVTGDGQVNFKVNVEDGYEISSVEADKNYKNLKDLSDNMYRLTKIQGEVVVTVTTVEKSGEEGTILQPDEFYVFDQKIDFDFGLGDPDEVNLFDSTDSLVEKISWSAHAAGVLARVPDGVGAMTEVATSTKGASNNGESSTKPDYKGAIAWPGSDKVITYDEGKSMFQSDSSGLDFYKGQLYCINNKKGTFWVMDVNKDGSMDYADGFTQTGKNLAFAHDAADPSASNPDAEGITVANNGLAYAAVERDNNDNKVNANWILQFDPWADGTTVIASAEWNITSLLPDVPANAGIESVEWVANDDVAGKLYDENAGAAFDPSNYPNATASGVFFVALENNGHVYAFVLNNDGSAKRIADIDPGIGGAMALDYDKYEYQ